MVENIPDWLDYKCNICRKPIALPNFPLSEQENRNFHRGDDHGFPIDDPTTYGNTRRLPKYQRDYLEEHPYVFEDTVLKCGHHFHRECLQVHYGGLDLENAHLWRYCPLGIRKRPVHELNENGRLIVCYRNEGGITRRLDLSSEFEGGDFVPPCMDYLEKVP